MVFKKESCCVRRMTTAMVAAHAGIYHCLLLLHLCLLSHSCRMSVRKCDAAETPVISVQHLSPALDNLMHINAPVLLVS